MMGRHDAPTVARVVVALSREEAQYLLGLMRAMLDVKQGLEADYEMLLALTKMSDAIALAARRVGWSTEPDAVARRHGLCSQSRHTPES